MRIGVTTFGCDLKSGMSRYVSNLITQFSRLTGDFDFHVLAHDSARGEYLKGANTDNITAISVSEKVASPIVNIGWHQTILPRLCRKENYDALFLPAASRRTPLTAPCPTIGTVHDMSPFHVSGKYDPSRNFYQTRVLPRLLRSLTHIIAISESTKRDIQKYAGVSEEKISVIHHAADSSTFYPRRKEDCFASLEKYGIRAPYLTYTSRIESPGKNHLRLIQAFENLKEAESIPHQLVLAGADWHGSEKVHEAVARSRYRDDILLTGYLPASDLPHLYGGAEMMVFPSLFEGFGLPILEAMSCGTPVACSNISSMPEIAGDAAVLFDPTEVDSIEGSLHKVLSCGAMRTQLSRAGLKRSADFSWKKTAVQTLQVVQNAV